MTVSRRDFLATAVVGSLSVGLPGVASGAQDSAGPNQIRGWQASDHGLCE